MYQKDKKKLDTFLQHEEQLNLRKNEPLLNEVCKVLVMASIWTWKCHKKQPCQHPHPQFSPIQMLESKFPMSTLTP